MAVKDWTPNHRNDPGPTAHEWASQELSPVRVIAGAINVSMWQLAT